MSETGTYTGERNNTPSCTAGIIGGGLAGLALSIQLSKAGYETVLFEKEKYPFHKVCGEYISMESRKFIERLGLDLSGLNLPLISKLIISSPAGKVISSGLDPGGFGVSRYFLDNRLREIALQSGVIIHEGTKVNQVNFKEGTFTIKFNGGEITSKTVAGCFGKRSNLDVKWQRDFIRQKPGNPDNYIGVKYHVKNPFPADTIALHNFKNGYCGISKVENGEFCLCYLTTAKNLKDHHHSIREMEKNLLYTNPFLKEIFTESEFIWKEPVTISQISFVQKNQIEDHVLMLGDAAGMITPLCGNGMSMALHSSAIAYKIMDSFLKGTITREEMERQYVQQWRSSFARRLRNGRLIQAFFGREILTNLFIQSIKPFPFMIQRLIKATHGKEF